MRIFELFSPYTSTVDKICRMNFVLGKFFADCVVKLVEEASLSLDDIDLIGSHGQTIYHIPEPKTTWRYRSRSTFQIGELAVITERTGIPTVGDFRKRDVSAGGEGTPLTPYLDYILHRHERLNIGGIANLTFLPADSSLAKEDVLMAILANEFVIGNAANVPSATGAGKRVILGTFVPGSRRS